MAKKLTLVAGKTRIEMNDELQDLTNSLLNKLLPNTRKEWERELNQIEDEARSRWLVRKENSKDSRGKIYSGLSITPDFKLVGHAGSKAPYAWAIKVGGDKQQSKLQKDDRLADKLIWTPVKDKTNDLADIIANEIIKQIKK